MTTKSKKTDAAAKVQVGVKPSVTDLSEFADVTLSEDVDSFRYELYKKYMEPYQMELPPHVMKQLYKASLAQSSQEKADLLEKARQKAEVHYLALWSKGKIKNDTTAKPMPDDIKQKLRD